MLLLLLLLLLLVVVVVVVGVVVVVVVGSFGEGGGTINAIYIYIMHAFPGPPHAAAPPPRASFSSPTRNRKCLPTTTPLVLDL